MVLFRKGMSVVRLGVRFQKIYDVIHEMARLHKIGVCPVHLKDEIKILAHFYSKKVLLEIRKYRLSSTLMIRIGKRNQSDLLEDVTRQVGNAIMSIADEAEIGEIVVDIITNCDESKYYDPPSYKLNWTKASELCFMINDLNKPSL